MWQIVRIQAYGYVTNGARASEDDISATKVLCDVWCDVFLDFPNLSPVVKWQIVRDDRRLLTSKCDVWCEINRAIPFPIAYGYVTNGANQFKISIS